MTNPMENDEVEVKNFYKSIFYESLIYNKYLLLKGYTVDPKVIREAELKVYSELNNPSYRGEITLGLRELDELRLLLYIVDPHPEDFNNSTKAQVIRLDNVIVRMRSEHNHQRPHFHIEYKQQFNASYAIDTLEKLAGNMPDRYEKRVLEWAVDKKTALISIWNNLQEGKEITEFILQVQ